MNIFERLVKHFGTQDQTAVALNVKQGTVSGWGREADKARAMSAGFDAHLTKPASAVEVRRLVRTARKL